MEMEKVDPRSPEQTVDTDVVEMVGKQNEKLSLWGKEFVTISVILLSKPGPSYMGVLCQTLAKREWHGSFRCFLFDMRVLGGNV